jgi:crotonobetainyl-CoA:carnitine CoA-transferase CaiB-like acyl-CoA transferase
MDRDEFYANARRDLSGPLAGVTVVEATTTWAGPMAACVLADFGADVIKVEQPEGEVVRRLPPVIPDSTLTVPYETVNRNKQSLSLRLSTPEGAEVFLALAKRADIIIENFRPGTMAKWGVGYQDVKGVNPQAVYVSISGYGQFGPMSERVGYDPVAQHYVGWASLNGEPDGAPVKAPTYLGDDTAGLHGALGALAAYQHAQRTGEGQHVDVALTDGLLFQSNGYLTAGAMDLPLERWGSQFPIAAPINRYRAKDGWVYAGVLLDSHWARLAEILGRPELADDERYNSLAGRINGRETLDGLLADWCAEHTRGEIDAIFAAAGIPATPVNSYGDAAREEHVLARDMLQTTELSDGQQVPLTGPAAKFSRTPTRIRTAARPIGADNDGLLESLGYSAEDLATLRDKGVI